MAFQEDTQQERTEPATPRRREEIRNKGQVAKSIEINSTAIIFVSLLFLFFFGRDMMVKGQYDLKVVLENIANIEITADNLQGYLILFFQKSLTILLPILLIMMFVGSVINLAQVGFLFTFDPLLPKWNRVDPFAGLKRIFASKKAAVELIKSIFKILIIGIVTYITVKGDLADYILLMDKDPAHIFSFVAWETFEVSIKIIIIFLIIAFLDYLFQRHDFEESIKMTKQEVKEDLRQMEGDPQIKARIRSIQRDIARRRMMQSVKEADVVITNPTTLAIAIQYDLETMSAPVVIAKGARLIAEKIKNIAREHGIPIVEDKPLAQSLFKAVEVGDEIPEQFFQAVAQILAYVYRLKKKVVV